MKNIIITLIAAAALVFVSSVVLPAANCCGDKACKCKVEDCMKDGKCNCTETCCEDCKCAKGCARGVKGCIKDGATACSCKGDCCSKGCAHKRGKDCVKDGNSSCKGKCCKAEKKSYVKS